MFDLIAWKIRRLVDVRQAIREMDLNPEFLSDDLGIRRNGLLAIGERGRDE